jgi:isoleucyl-tRNA synthetase
VIQAAKAGRWRRHGEETVVTTPDGDVPLLATEYEVTTVVGGDGSAGEIAASVLPDGGFTVLDLAITPELEAEGYARDLIRLVQDTRKASGLDVADRIVLDIAVPADRVAAVETHRDLVAAETLAVALTVTAGDGAEPQVAVARRPSDG